MRNKILMITAMLAVMVAITGIAAATSVDINTSNAVGNPDTINNPLDGSTVTSTDVLLYSITGPSGIRTLRVESSNPNLYVRVYNTAIGFNTGFTNSGNEASWTWSGSGTQSFTVEIYGTSAASGATVTVLDKNGGALLGTGLSGIASGTADISIPEFPLVALPIAAVIALVFIFQQRKNKKE